MTGAKKKMVTGFNHNIKHKGQIFHVQTEDSGVDNPHIITHLFVGGNILASKKSSYEDILHADNLQETVRTMMEEQHKEMLRSLISGAYDEVIARYSDRAWQPGVVDGAPAPPEPAALSAGAVAPAVGAVGKAPPPPGAAPPAHPSTPPQPPSPPAPPSPSSSAPPVPPEVVAAQQMAVGPVPKEGGDTIFGEDLISERSLDEVILSYLAEDGDEP
jgi:hypothetical protein